MSLLNTYWEQNLILAICSTECAPFVDRLLATLRSKSYLPYSDAVAPTPIQPYEGPRGKKRPLEQDDQEWARDRESRPPPKGPRLNQDRPDRRMGPPPQPRNESYIPPLPRNRRNMNGGNPWPQQVAPGTFPPGMTPMNPPAANGGADSRPEAQAQRNNEEPCYDYHSMPTCFYWSMYTLTSLQTLDSAIVETRALTRTTRMPCRPTSCKCKWRK